MDDYGPTTYFYCMDAGVEVCRVKAAEAFIDSTFPIDSATPKFYFLSNRHLIENETEKIDNDKQAWNWKIKL